MILCTGQRKNTSVETVLNPIVNLDLINRLIIVLERVLEIQILAVAYKGKKMYVLLQVHLHAGDIKEKRTECGTN